MPVEVQGITFTDEQYALVAYQQSRAIEAERQVDDLVDMVRGQTYMVGLRFTLSQDRGLPEAELDNLQGGINHFISDIVFRRLIYPSDRVVWSSYGFEHKNKKGEECKPHIHIHMEVNISPDTMRQRLRRYFAKGTGLWLSDSCHHIFQLGFGKDYYACTTGTGEAKHRFARYPWKQTRTTRYGRIPSPNEPDESTLEMTLESAIDCACEEYTRTVTKNLAKASHQTLQERLFEHLVVEGKDTTDNTVLINLTLDFYRKNHYSINQRNILGHIQAYRIERGLDSQKSIASQWAELL